MLILWSFFAVLAIAFHFNKVNPFRFDYFSTLIWLLALSVNFLGLISYPPLAATTIWFVVGCHLALIAGYNLVGVRTGGGYVFVGNIGFRMQVLAILTLVFVALVAGRVLLERELPFSGGLTNLQDARAEHWERGGAMASPIDQAVRIFLYAAIGYVMLAPLVLRRWLDTARSLRGRLIPHVLLMLVAGTLIIDQAMRDAGRALIVYLTLGMIAIYLALFRLDLKKSILISVGIVPLIFFLAITFYQHRNSNFYRNEQFYITYNCAGGRPEPWVLRGSEVLKAGTISSCYLTSPVHNLDKFLRNNSGRWDHTFGIYNASIISGDLFSETREKLARYYRSLKQSENPWATAARDYWLDWSWWSVIAFFFTGLLFGFGSRKRVFGSETALLRFGLIAIAGFLIPFLSPLINRTIIYTILVTILIDLVAAGVSPVQLRRQSARFGVQRPATQVRK